MVIAAAVLDLAVAKLLSRRFIDSPEQSDSFLGVNGDGRAPAASFRARIQLALLLGIITESDAEILRAIKELRNLFAHRVRLDFCSLVVQKPLRALYTPWHRGLWCRRRLSHRRFVEWSYAKTGFAWRVRLHSGCCAGPAIAKLMFDPAFLKSMNALHAIVQMTKNLKPSQETPIVYHDFFFHSGRMGAIRIEIMTQAANASWRSQLDRLVLETLRFSGP